MSNFPATALALLGIVITVLGLFAAGNITIVVVGLVAVFAGGLLEVFSRQRV